MSEWQDVEKDTQVWSETVSPLEQTADSLEQKAFDDFEDADDFGGFGEPNADSTGDDFGDFGDFNDFEPISAQVVAETSKPFTSDDTEDTKSLSETVSKPKKSVDIEASVIDALLTKTTPLFDPLEASSIDDKVALLSQCLAQSFDMITVPSFNSTTAADPDSDPFGYIDDSHDPTSSISSLLNNAQIPFPEEPRLLWNLIFSIVADKIPESIRTLLLTPQSELDAASGIAQENQYRDSDVPEEPAALLCIDRIRQLAAQDAASSSSSTDMLFLAIRSLDSLISAKEQEIAKRKDAIDAYNQVIQTLVVQATKLH
ncbi:hypothetical protein J3B02_001314 [Coemansia erecta]|uniref:Uncharacterized protein n=1 Tax=Coemansia asiatica TaxID=1052880 RepID=A0A9W7XEZ5_9FUNG|nr:hypothetical protein LPJ64_006212 [Coemansia asiatica]KAJ2856942.1 hypothetical protein J3B02_001314 [Coemansia erecta]